MIGVEGQYVFDLRTELDVPLVRTNELLSLSIIEECGLLLPVFKIHLLLSDIKNLSYLHEGSIIKLALGKNKKDLKYINLQIFQAFKETTNDPKISLVATLYKPTFSKTSKTKVFPNSTSIDLITSIADQYFEIESNSPIAQDRKSWCQFGISDKLFLEHLWFNSNLSTGILGIGCSSIDNIFVVKDIIKIFTTSGYDHKASYHIKENENETDFKISKITGASASTGFYNSWQANNKTLINFNPSTDQFEIKNLEIETMLSTSEKTSKNEEVEKDVPKISFTSQNNFFDSKKYNLFILSNYSKFQIELDADGQYHKVKLLDKIYLDLGSESSANKEYYSGNYVVSRVVRSIISNRYNTKVALTREAPGNLR